jgi:hypothetical protein
MNETSPIRIFDYQKPNWSSNSSDWRKWRLTFSGGDEFRFNYLQKIDEHEDQDQFNVRSSLTPSPAYAKQAIIDIRNAMFARLQDIVRRDGSPSYQNAVEGLNGGVDRRGSTMSAFIGIKVLTDLLLMGAVGIFVDNPALQGPTIKDSFGLTPYLYQYAVEDILSFTCSDPAEPSEYQAVLLRDTTMEYDSSTMLPTAMTQRYRRLWIGDDGYVMVQFYDNEGTVEDKPPLKLGLTRIPFVLLDIGNSLIKDTCNHQIAMLNLCSHDINYALRANFPFLTQQKDARQQGSHLKGTGTIDNTGTTGGQGASDNEVRPGVSHGIAYDMKAERPQFINPSPDPLKASMDLQAKLEADIRKLVSLAVMTLATRASAESKNVDNQGMSAGLSYIGTVLENAERKISEYWAIYEEKDANKRAIPLITYPTTYSLKDDDDRIKESGDLSKLVADTPSHTAKCEIGKLIVQTLLGGKVSVEKIAKINAEIDAAEYTTSDPLTILPAQAQGVVDTETAAAALGFGPDVAKKAKAEHAERVATIAAAQGIRGSDPGARGVKDLSSNQQAGSQERQVANDTTLKDTTQKPVRGEGANPSGV